MLLQELLKEPWSTTSPAVCSSTDRCWHNRWSWTELRYRDAREEQAHRLLAIEDQVQLARIHDLGLDSCTAIDGGVQDRQPIATIKPRSPWIAKAAPSRRKRLHLHSAAPV
ncbi:MAG: hypothetical protein R3F44_09595 [Candidatus Competibacteraceae bacterium]